MYRGGPIEGRPFDSSAISVAASIRPGGPDNRTERTSFAIHSQCVQIERASRGRLRYDARTSEMGRRSTAGPRLDAGAGVPQSVSPRPARWPDQPSAGLLGAPRPSPGQASEVRARMRRSRSPTSQPGMVERPIQAPGPLGAVLRIPSSHVRGQGPGDDRAGRSCARQVQVAGQRAQPERPAPPSNPRAGGPAARLLVRAVRQ
jgi:hypothetical protein